MIGIRLGYNIWYYSKINHPYFVKIEQTQAKNTYLLIDMAYAVAIDFNDDVKL